MSTPPDDADRPLSDLVTVGDAAAVLGVSRQYVHTLTRDDPRFPEPVGRRPGRARVWRRSDVEQYDRERRSRPGRNRWADRRPPARTPAEREWRQLSDVQRSVLRALGSDESSRATVDRINKITGSGFIMTVRGLTRRGAIVNSRRQGTWCLTDHGTALLDAGRELEDG